VEDTFPEKRGEEKKLIKENTMDKVEITLKREAFAKTISLHYLDEGRCPSLEMGAKVVSKFYEIIDVLEEDKRKEEKGNI